MEQFMKKTIVVWLGALVCCLLWGSAFPCIKIGYEWTNIASDETATQILYAGYRFFLAGFMVVLTSSIGAKRFIHPKKSSLHRVVKLCMLQTVFQYLFFYIGLAHTTGVKASIIEGMNVFVAILVASLVFRQEKLTMRKMLGCIIGFAGVVLINITDKGIDTSLSLLGEGFIFFSTVSYALSSIIIKRYSAEENPVMLSGWQFMVGGLIMIVSGLVMGGRVSFISVRSVVMLVYLAAVSAIAYTIWSMLLKYNPISRVAVFGFMNPVFGVILSAIFLHEADSLHANAVIALVLVCAGIYIVNRAKKER